MLFNSFSFFVFLPIVLMVYYIIPPKVRYIWLLIVSYFFYMFWNVKYVVLLLGSKAITYFSGLALEWIKGQDWSQARIQKWKKICVAASFSINLSILFIFKYFNFVIDNISEIFRSLNIEAELPIVNLLLPVGISFYIFQALSYTMDVFRNEIYAEKNFLKYALFVSFFPQLVSGPIERSKNLLKQINKMPSATREGFRDGILLMIWGFFQKLVVADRIGIFVDTIYGTYMEYAGWYYILATILFAFQIYCDFSGYSIIAMGTAKLMGFQLMENFNAPYLAKSVAEFWRRWHISLSSWFMDYLYIPLGGNRKGIVRKHINKLIVFAVSGLWHGANWTFVIWGLLNGLYQVVGEVLKPIRNGLKKIFGIKENSIASKALAVLFTFSLVDISWLFFRANDIEQARYMLKGMFTAQNMWILFDGSLYTCGLDAKNFILMILAIGVLLFADMCKYKGITIRRYVEQQDGWFRWLFYATVITFILLTGIWGTEYNEANFIYFQF